MSNRKRATLRQEALCLQQAMDPYLPGLVLEIAFRVDGFISAQQLKSRIDDIVRQHIALRQRFEFQDGKYWVMVSPETTGYCRIRTIDESGVTTLSEALLPASRQPIEIESERLFQAEIVEAKDNLLYLVVRVHHAIADLWSIGLLVANLDETCVEKIVGRETKIKHPNVCIDEDFWVKTLSQESSLSLPIATRGLSEQRKMVAYPFVLGPLETAGITQLAKDCTVTPYSVLLAAQALTLSKLGMSQRVPVAITIHGRNKNNYRHVGYFANTIALPIDIADFTVGEYVKHTGTQLRHAMQATVGAGYPELSMLMAKEMLQAPVPNAALVFQQDTPGMPKGLAAALLGHGQVRLGELTLSALIAPPCIGPFSNTILLTQHDNMLFGRAEVDPAQHPAWLAQAMAEQFELTIQAMTRHPQCALSILPQTNARQDQQLAIWENGPQPSNNPETLIASIFKHIALCPDQPAIRSATESINYAELGYRVASIAGELRARGLEKGHSVGILLSRNVNLIPTLLAVMASGGNYVPLSAENPLALNQSIVRKAGCRAIITDLSVDQALFDMTECWLLGELLVEKRRQLEDLSDLKATAYVLFTSGSTGQPKGVVISHENTANLMFWATYVYGREQLQCTLAVTPITFDLSVFEMFSPLVSGACVMLVHSVIDIIDHPSLMNGVTLLNTVPSAVEALLHHNALNRDLRVVNLAGEPLSPHLYYRLRHVLPDSRIVNLYGPTETTTYSTGVELTQPHYNTISIGHPLTGTRLRIVDENLKSVGIGVLGELVIYGRGVAQGYINDPERSAASFLLAPDGQRFYRTGDLARWLPDGNVDFVGRKDDQVKIRGFRVELGAIQTALLAIENVEESVVLVRGEGQQQQIVAFISLSTQEQNHAAHINNIKQTLARQLPPYAIPAAFHVLARLPRNRHGKVDRNLLLQENKNQKQQKQYDREMTVIEKRVAACWKQIIGADVGLDDNFLEIGGHSLTLTRLTGLLRREFNIHIPIYDLWTKPTIEQQADFIHSLLDSTAIKSAPTVIPRLNRNNTDN